MKTETCLEIQACLDGELDHGREVTISALCEQDAEARALRDALKGVRDAVRRGEPEYPVPETREFYWSQIQRRIEAEERTSERRPARSLSAFSGIFRWLVPVGGLAAVALVFTLRDQTQADLRSLTLTAGAPFDVSSVEYRSDADGVTVHWIN